MKEERGIQGGKGNKNQQLDPDKMRKEEGGEGNDGEKREGWGRKI